MMRIAIAGASGLLGTAAAKRGPGRPPKAKAAPAMAELDGITGIVAAVQASERERAKLHAALEKVQAAIAAALS